jgi:hypothetical protein
VKYWMEYVTFLSFGNEYGVAESTIHDIVVLVVTVLIKNGKFDFSEKNLRLVKRLRSAWWT